MELLDGSSIMKISMKDHQKKKSYLVIDPSRLGTAREKESGWQGGEQEIMGGALLVKTDGRFEIHQCAMIMLIKLF